MTIARVISASEINITRPISSLLLFNSFSSPAYSSLQPGGSWMRLMALRARARTLEGNSPNVEKDITVSRGWISQRPAQGQRAAPRDRQFCHRRQGHGAGYARPPL